MSGVMSHRRISIMSLIYSTQRPRISTEYWGSWSSQYRWMTACCYVDLLHQEMFWSLNSEKEDSLYTGGRRPAAWTSYNRRCRRKGILSCPIWPESMSIVKITWFDLAEWFPKTGSRKHLIHTHNFAVALIMLYINKLKYIYIYIYKSAWMNIEIYI